MRRLAQFVLLLPMVFLVSCGTLQSTSNTHGPAARSIAHLSHAMTIAFLITTVSMWLLLAIALKKRCGSFEEHMPIDVGGGQVWVVIGGLAIPLLVLSVFLFFGLELLSDFPIHGGNRGMGSMDGAAITNPDILIIGHQWWWEVQYLNVERNQQVTTANEIHIPAHRAVNIELRSADVMHSFWVPSLHGKVDLVPGHPNFIRIEASEPGDFIGQCAEYCGEQHANMHILVVSQEPAAFEKWLADQRKPASEPANPGMTISKQIFVAGRCAKCHTVRGTLAAGRAGPDLTHIGSRKYIGANSFPNNNAYLEAWVTDAQSLKPGCKMPIINQYDGVQLRHLVAYLRQLQ